jgi:outer membrane usher protein
MGSTLPKLLWAATAAGAIAGPACVGAQDAERLYLELFVNDVDQQLIVELERRGERLYIALDELAAAGVLIDDLAASADRRIALDELTDARYSYEPLEQRLDLQLPAARLTPNLLGYVMPSVTMARSDMGLVLNYAMNVQSEPLALEQRASRRLFPLTGAGYGRTARSTDPAFQSAYDSRNRTVTLDTDLRYFAPFGVFVDRGYFAEESGEADRVRYDTYWTYEQVDSLRNYVVGDYVSSALTWTRSVRLGGLRAARNFDVRPDLVTFPIPEFGANAVVPTTVDLYVNGRQQFSGSTDAGPFVVVDPPALTGAGEVTLVYRDAAGREVVTTQPLYVDSRLLDRGLSDYAFEAGYPRRNYGTASSDYGKDLATAASLRYGVTDLLTLEGHAETAEELDNLGLGALVALGRFGVLNMSYAESADAATRGTQQSAGYQYVAQHWSFDVYERRTYDDYRDIGTLEGSPVPTRFSRAGASVSFGDHTGSINYTRQEDPTFGGSRILSAAYNSNWANGRVSVFLTGFRDLDNEDGDGAYFAVSMNFGERSHIYSGVSRYGDDETTVFGTGRPVDYDVGGIGWNLYAERGNDDYSRGTARLDYRNRFGDWSAVIEQTSDATTEEETNAALYGSGSIVYMRGGLFASRSIYDGFALVSTPDTPDVPVLRENRLLGSTNRRGYLLVPDLPAYQTSRLGIDPLDLPVDVNVGAVRLDANPRSLSGVRVEFPLERFRGATVVLVDAAGIPLAASLRATLVATGESALIGYDGRVFFAALEPSNRISVETPDGVCEVDVPFAAEDTLRTIGPFVCAAEEP